MGRDDLKFFFPGRFPPLRAGRDSLRASLPQLVDNDQVSDGGLSSALHELDLNSDTSPGMAKPDSNSTPAESASGSTPVVSSDESKSGSESSPAGSSPGGRRQQRPFRRANEKDLGTPV